jgi:hypothetical protein
MKTKIFTLTFFAFYIICFGQTNDKSQREKFEYLEVGLCDFVVANVDGKAKEEIYNKTLNWIKETYKNPDIVLKMKIENEKLRIDGVANNLLKIDKSSFNLDYIIEISFKDNKYKFELVSLLYGGTGDYKNVPNFKTDKKMLKHFGTTAVYIENYFNNLNQSLKDYILGKTEEKW